MNKEEEIMFYKKINGTIPMRIIEDFSEESNFLLLFVNPKSGKNLVQKKEN